MTDYISREAAISHPFANGQYDSEHASKDFIMGYESYKEWLEALPAADVKPVVKGKWETDANGWYFCSECGHEMFFTGTYDEDQHFCYYCGADMRPRETLKEAAESADTDTLMPAT